MPSESWNGLSFRSCFGALGTVDSNCREGRDPKLYGVNVPRGPRIIVQPNYVSSGYLREPNGLT